MTFNNRVVAVGLMASGALPFIGAGALAYFGGGDVRGYQADQIAVAYGAVILSFLGGIRWGDALAKGPATTLFISVLPSLAGFLALLINNFNGTILLSFGFIVQALWDYAAPGTLPHWFIQLRMAVSALVVICLAITVVY